MKKTLKDDKKETLGEAANAMGNNVGEKVESHDAMVEKMNALVGDLQRTRADFENYRKQVEVQKAGAVKSAQLATVYKLLPLLDDIDRAIVTYNAELAPVAKTLGKTMKELGLSRIEAGVDTEFNPDLHDAVMAEGDGENEVIAEELRPGYYYGTEVLRPAMVKVKKI